MQSTFFLYTHHIPILLGKHLASIYSQVTVAAVRAGDVLSGRPGVEHVTKFTVTGKDRYFLMQTGEKGEIRIQITTTIQ